MQLAQVAPRLHPSDGIVGNGLSVRRIPQFARGLGDPPTQLAETNPLQSFTIRETFQGQNDSRIFIIQDIHANLEAQRNTAQGLTAFFAGKKVDLVAVEGAFGKFDFKPFRNYPDRKLARNLAEGFLEAGLIGSPSYAAVTSEADPPPYYGVDDSVHYGLNVRAIRQGARNRKAAFEKLSKARKQLGEEKKSSLNPRLAEVDALYERYLSADMDLGQYLHSLNQIQGISHPMVSKYLKAYRLEKTLNFAAAERERRTILEQLVKKAGQKGSSKLLELAGALQNGALTLAGFYQELEQYFAGAGLNLAQYPAFSDYLAYISLSEAINVDELLVAVDEFSERFMASLAKTDLERLLIRQTRELYLADKLVKFELTPREWDKYRKTVPIAEYRVPNDERVIARTRLGGDEAISSGKRGNFEIASLTSFARNDILSTQNSTLGIDLSPFEAFYREAEIRSERMIENLLTLVPKLSPREKETSANVIFFTGGFHTPQVTQLLKEKGISYQVLSPKITRLERDNGTDYLSQFTREKTPLEQIFESQKISILQADTLLGAAGPHSLAKNRLFLWFLKYVPKLSAPNGKLEIKLGDRQFLLTWNAAKQKGYDLVMTPIRVGQRGFLYVFGKKDFGFLRNIPALIQWVFRVVSNHRYLVGSLLVLIYIIKFGFSQQTCVGVSCAAFVGLTVYLSGKDEDVLKELDLNFDPRFHSRAFRLLSKPRQEWSQADEDEVKKLASEARKAYDWMEGWIRTSDYYEKIKGHSPVLLSAEGIISAVEMGMGRHLKTYAGGLGILFGEWIRAIAYLGGVTTLDPASEAPEFLIFIPHYSSGVQISQIDPFDTPDANAWEAIDTKDFGDNYIRDPDKPAEKLTVRVPLWDPDPSHSVLYAEVQYRSVRVGGLQIIMPETNDETDHKRDVLKVLYQGHLSSRERFEQEWVAWISAFEVRKRLHLAQGPVHLNETATFPYLIGLIRDHMEDFMEKGVPLSEAYDYALEKVGGQTIFFTHTLVAAGIDRFNDDNAPIGHYIYKFFYERPRFRSKAEFGATYAGVVARWMMEGKKSDILGVTQLPHFKRDGFSFPLRFIVRLILLGHGQIAAVSQLNAKKAEEFFVEEGILEPWEVQSQPVIGLTNGVDSIFWMIPRIRDLMNWMASNVQERKPHAILNPSDPLAQYIHNVVKGESIPEDYTEPAINDMELRQELHSAKVNAVDMVRRTVKQQYIRNVANLRNELRRQDLNPRDHEAVEIQLGKLLARWSAWTGVAGVPEDPKEMAKQNLDFLLNPNDMLAVWARRNVQYKRMLLTVFGSYLPEIEQRVSDNRPVSHQELDFIIDEALKKGACDSFIKAVMNEKIQFVFAGPYGQNNVRLLHRLIDRLSVQYPEMLNRVIYMEGYNDEKSQYLTRGADLWLNTPRRPEEASGTSGMKIMGVNIFAMVDGWAASGLHNGVNGLAGNVSSQFGTLDHPANWKGPKNPNLVSAYIHEEAQSYYSVLSQAAAMFKKDQLIAKQELKGESEWLNLVRRSIFSLAAVYDVRGEFTGRNVPSFDPAIPGGWEPGLLAMYAKAIKLTQTRETAKFISIRKFFRFVKHSLMVKAHSHGVLVTVKVKVDKEALTSFENFSSLSNFMNHLDIYIYWAPNVDGAAWTHQLASPAQISEDEFILVSPLELKVRGNYRFTALAVPHGVKPTDEDLWSLQIWYGRPVVDDAVWPTPVNPRDVAPTPPRFVIPFIPMAQVDTSPTIGQLILNVTVVGLIIGALIYLFNPNFRALVHHFVESVLLFFRGLFSPQGQTNVSSSPKEPGSIQREKPVLPLTGEGVASLEASPEDEFSRRVGLAGDIVTRIKTGEISNLDQLIQRIEEVAPVESLGVSQLIPPEGRNVNKEWSNNPRSLIDFLFLLLFEVIPSRIRFERIEDFAAKPDFVPDSGKMVFVIRSSDYSGAQEELRALKTMPFWPQVIEKKLEIDLVFPGLDAASWVFMSEGWTILGKIWFRKDLESYEKVKTLLLSSHSQKGQEVQNVRVLIPSRGVDLPMPFLKVLSDLQGSPEYKERIQIIILDALLPGAWALRLTTNILEMKRFTDLVLSNA